MITKKTIIAASAGFVIMFMLAGLWYTILMKDYNSEQFAVVQRPELNMYTIMIAYLLQAFLLAIVYPIGYKGGYPAIEAVKFGLLMGLLLALPAAIIFYSSYTVPLIPTLINTLYLVGEKVIGGLVIGIVYGPDGKEKN